jgi:ArsR family transcriptional regulator, arsenate/arsenite/antimonite-responsive transcriptional repressor
MHLANLYSGQGRYDEAWSLVRRSLELDPTDHEVFRQAGDLQRVRGDCLSASPDIPRFSVDSPRASVISLHRDMRIHVLPGEKRMLQEVERTLKAVADGTRLRILRMVQERPLCVCQIVEVLGLSQSTVSKHLALLKNAGLIEDEKRGKWVFYRRGRGAGGAFAGSLAGLLAESLRREPRVERDLRNSRHPRVRKLAECCPSPPEPM